MNPTKPHRRPLSTTAKTMLFLGLIFVVNVILMFVLYALFIDRYSARLYETEARQGDEEAQEVCALLEADNGAFDTLDRYLENRGISCAVTDESGRTLYARLPELTGAYVSAVGTGTVCLPDGTALSVRVWSEPIAQNFLSEAMKRSALTGTAVIDVCIFVLVAVMMFILLLWPMRKLRKTMQDYTSYGAVPPHTPRLDEFGRLQNAYVDVIETLQLKEKDTHRLIASIAHDIRTPLTSVMGYSERLLSAELTQEKRRQYQQSVYDKAVAIKSVVDEFDEYIEAGQVEPDAGAGMTVGELCDGLRREYCDELADMNVRFELAAACPDVKIRCSYDRMRRFFGNLIGNSIQHAGAERLELRLQCTMENRQVVFAFSDNGRGVDPALMGRIFEPFFTSDEGRKVSGLGLSICKSIIQSCGGAIGAENLPEGGFLIRATIPCAR